MAQHVLVIAIAEALHPGDTVATNYLSDLGVGQTALMYNASAVVFGGFVLIGSLVGRRTLGAGLTITLAVTGACAVGAGLFPETTGAPHSIFALVLLSFGAVSAILSYRVLRPPLSYVSVGLGIFALVADVLFFTHHDLGIGPGGGAHDCLSNLCVGPRVRRGSNRRKMNYESASFVFLNFTILSPYF